MAARDRPGIPLGGQNDGKPFKVGRTCGYGEGDPDKQCARSTAIMSRFVMRDLQEIRPCNFFPALCVHALHSATMCTIHIHIHTITLTHKP